MRPAARPSWDTVSREFSFVCEPSGRIVSADRRTRRHLDLQAGASLLDAAAPGMQDKLAAFLDRAVHDNAADAELALVARGAVITCSFHAEPHGGHIDVLGCCLPHEFTTAQREVQHAMTEIVELNREIGRQKRQIEQQKSALERTVSELDESNRGITALHRELEEKADALQHTADVKSRVMAHVTHEFRSPLHTILGLSRMLLETPAEPLTDEQRKQVQFIRVSAEQLSTVVDDMLDLSRVEAGKSVVRAEPFRAQDFLASLRGTLRPLLKPGSPVALEFAEPEADFALETDSIKIAQIVRNLVSNALKFTERGTVRVQLAAEGEDLVVRVIDTGIGIAPRNFEAVFEEFGQIDSPLQRRVKGSGLGLPLSRRLAHLLGGSLDVESTPGAGSTFTLRVPRVHLEARELHEIEARPLDPARLPILVVEDDPKTIFVYERFLAMTGHQVVPARTVSEAEQLLRSFRPAAIVLDIMLERETTWGFLGRLKQDPETADIPVLVVTVTGREQKARALGADEFWLKPFDRDLLLKKLKTLRDSQRARLLLVDDDEKSRYLIRKYLQDSPYQLIEAETGAEGVRLAQHSHPDLILLDFLLGDTTAFDVLDELKADPRTRHIPVIVITSLELEAGELERLHAQTEVVLSKESLSREIAINRIRDALGKSGLAPGRAVDRY